MNRRRPGPAPEDSAAPKPGRNLRTLDLLVSHVGKMNVITEEEARYITRMLRDLENKGAAAVPAMRDFLREGEDVNFAAMSGGELVGHRTLRQAMIDVLGKIGGSEAMALCLEQMQRTTDPIETVMLARSLEKGEPGVHSEQVIQSISDALRWAGQAPAQASPDVGPLFGLLRTYRSDQAVGLLERAAPEWEEYALIALADLPEAAGIPSLAALAIRGDAAVPNPVLPFQILAQASVEYPEASDALLDLARGGHIPDQVWDAMGEALEGKHLQFSRKMFDGTPLAESGTAASDGRPWKNYYVEWLNVRYEQDVVSADWSDERVEHQLALIDDLSEATSSAAAARALEQARESLQRARGEAESPMPGG